MYIKKEELIFIMLKSFIVTVFIMSLPLLNILNYKIGMNLCIWLDIPIDLSLTIMSPGLIIDFTVVLFVIELIVIFYLLRYITTIKSFYAVTNL